MCVICYVPKNKTITKANIEDMFYTNPDGAGFMYADGKQVYYKKGFFDVDSLVKAFLSIPERYPRVLHCRISTSGKVDAKCCHPFPVSNNLRKMGKPCGTTKLAFCHNGILSDFTPPKGANYNDTMLFNKNVLSQLPLNKMTLDFIGEAIGTSKLAIMYPAGVTLLGKWEQKDGVFYSNLNHDFYLDGYKYHWYGLDESIIKVKNMDDETAFQMLLDEGCEPEYIGENTFSVLALPKKVKFELVDETYSY